MARDQSAKSEQFCSFLYRLRRSNGLVDVACWPTASRIAAQANVSFLSKSGSDGRALETALMTHKRLGAALPASFDRWTDRRPPADHSIAPRRVQWFVKKGQRIWKAEPLFRKLSVRGPDMSGLLVIASLIERFGHACLDWLGSLSRDLLRKRAKVFILR